MRKLLLLSAFAFIACKKDPGYITEPLNTPEPISEAAPKKTFANERFKDVTVVETSPGQYDVTGKAQVFEAAFSWIVEDGHNEIAAGHEMTDAGAPEWGEFSFHISVDKEKENSVLHLILFEVSAEDGTRRKELAIPLSNNP